LLLLALSGLAASRAAAQAQSPSQTPLRFVASTSNAPPLDMFKDGELVSGIVKDIGDAVATRMSLQAVYVSLPRKRIEEAILSGEVDAICYASPAWYPRGLRWSSSVIENDDLIVSSPEVPALTAVAQLRGKTIGTVLGFVYPQLDGQIGNHYLRDEAPTAAYSLRKLRQGRIDYAIVDSLTLGWEARANPAVKKLPTLVLADNHAQCALAETSSIAFTSFNKAVDSLLQDGTIAHILGRYH
jgi:ABC-type amino acid transport substrate-binding protein